MAGRSADGQASREGTRVAAPPAAVYRITVPDLPVNAERVGWLSHPTLSSVQGERCDGCQAPSERFVGHPNAPWRVYGAVQYPV